MSRPDPERTMTIDLTVAECDLLKKVLDSYLSELRTEIAATKRATRELHEEETMIEEVQRKLAVTIA